MSWLSQEIAGAQQALAIHSAVFHAVAPSDADDIVRSVKHAFLTIPEQTSYFWWDQPLRNQALGVEFREPGVRQIGHLVPDIEQLVWFITNVEGRGEEEPIAIYEGTPDAAQRIVQEVRGRHEYYLVSKQLAWLICETHHGLVVVAGTPVLGRLQEYIIKHPEAIRAEYEWPSGP